MTHGSQGGNTAKVSALMGVQLRSRKLFSQAKEESMVTAYHPKTIAMEDHACARLLCSRAEHALSPVQKVASWLQCLKLGREVDSDCKWFKHSRGGDRVL